MPWQGEILRLAETAWIQGAYEEKDYPIGVRSSLSRAFSQIVDDIINLRFRPSLPFCLGYEAVVNL